MILEHYLEALRQDAGVEFLTWFRVEYADKKKTSHYFIHATNHSLGFKIMKDVMWRRGHSSNQQGALELEQASRTNLIPLFDDRGNAIKTEILDALKTGPLKAAVFYDQWVRRPEDLRSEPAYRAALLELEADQKVQVIGKDGITPTPAKDRKRNLGKPTLAKDYYIRLNNQKRK
jgi:hypothetical protein